ncbi:MULTISPECIES: SDR family NAD(P)-dependent oxidoreductase [unclassified Polaribacter]|jgi:short-subunit dehydrogenase|uniref:SDR family NAD(P)-dependent oxidoreductase n=1 Tax=unclassified Polaribacter TaxID=196858 RepID=UPI00052C68F0|nr:MULTISPECIES: SDR family NAD(P)-dependent oxidoreductase [unclassified Polaribacter]KGL59602.1 short chain dehydrogenase/reductase SDR [Polaribacter sp. Hel1_33_49]MDG1403421.1 SDR family NAD(P)-dependent oxidoreductase [Polaribacter sp.]MDG2437523.1 SDR family NAD(P)-dependent oxidoreductase [Polaribacter sp.]PKV64097.1 short-subunit dehydrogenase [Polaribacter sp. Hel1_33_96]
MKNVIVFGATSGIGKSIAKILLNEGYNVAITGRRLEKLIALKNEYPNQVLVKQNDIQNVKEVEKIFNEIVEEFETIDLVIQSSGVVHINPKFEWDKEAQSINTNVLGVTRVYTLSYNLFKKQQFGHLVGISSIASIRGNRSAPVYFASKAYQKAYLESLYIKTKSIKSKKVFITEIRPGFVATDMAVTLEDGVFWLVPLEKAVKQIYAAIKNKKRVAYISKRWQLIAWILKLAPAWLLKKVL